MRLTILPAQSTVGEKTLSTQLVTAPGRIVWGNPLVGRPKKDNNNQPVLKDGKPVTEYQFGLAIPKAQFAELGAAMQAEAQAACPQGIPADFAYKFKDGDTGTDAKGGALSAKTGYAGCYVIACSTEFPIPVYKRNGAAFEQLTQGVKTGDFVRVQLTINGHGRAPGKMGAKPGLYLNPNMVEFLGYGEEIRGAANPDDAFGAPVAALPQGASATPVASGPMPGNNAPNAAFPTAPQAPATPAEPNPAFPWGPKS